MFSHGYCQLLIDSFYTIMSADSEVFHNDPVIPVESHNYYNIFFYDQQLVFSHGNCQLIVTYYALASNGYYIAAMINNIYD